MNDKKAQEEIERKKAQAEYARKYNVKRANESEYCDACRMYVKKISLIKHKLAKKHIQNCNKDVKTTDEVALIELFENYKSKKIIFTEFIDELEEIITSIRGDEEDHPEPIMPKCDTKEEKKFCEQNIGCMTSEIVELLKNDDTLACQYKDELDDIDACDINAKKSVLNLWRKIKNTKNGIKVIDTPLPEIKNEKIVKFVEKIKKQEQENYIDEEFPTMARFIKASDIGKFKVLEFISDNRAHIFNDFEEEFSELKKVIEEEETDYYDDTYRLVLKIKNIHDDNISNLEEEQEMEEEQEESDED
jgi:hypothetical protein